MCAVTAISLAPPNYPVSPKITRSKPQLDFLQLHTVWSRRHLRDTTAKTRREKASQATPEELVLVLTAVRISPPHDKRVLSIWASDTLHLQVYGL